MRSRRTRPEPRPLVCGEDADEPPPDVGRELLRRGHRSIRVVGTSDLTPRLLQFARTQIGLTDRNVVVWTAGEDEGTVFDVPLSRIDQAVLEENGETVDLVLANGSELARVPGTRAARGSLRVAAEEINRAVGRTEPEEAVRACEKCGKEIAFGRFCVDCVDKAALARRLFAYLRGWPENALFITTSLLLGMLTALSLASPWIFKLLIDDVIPGRDWHLLAVVGGAMVGVRLGSIGFGALRGYLITMLGQRVTTRMKSQTFAHVMRLSLGFFQKRSAGEIIYRINSDIGRLQDFVTGWAQDLLKQLCQVLFIGVLLFQIHPRLAMLVLIPIPIITIGAAVFGRRISRSYLSVWRLGTKLTTRVADVIPGVRLVKTTGQEESECALFDGLAQACLNATMNVARKSSKFYPTLSSLTAAVELTVLLLGVAAIFRGELQVGALIAFLSYMSQFYTPMHGLVRINDRLVQAWTSAMRIFEVLDESPDIEDAEDAVALDPRSVQGRIEFRNVTFGYDPKKPVLENISFVLEPGESLGLVGKSGCGKSTLVALLLRAYDPQEGQILVDGLDIRRIKLSSLMSLFGVVLQEPFLFEGTVMDNIAYGVAGAGERRVVQAAKAAGAHDFIMEMRDGYDSLVGPHGAGLSGGQRQRIAIARAILRDPKVLILDEATSSLDSETEAQISANVQALIQGRTTVAVAHRLSTLESMSSIMVLEEGRVAERGPAAELRQRGGAFAHLSKLQGEPDRSASPPPEAMQIEAPDSVHVEMQPNGKLSVAWRNQRYDECYAAPTLPFTAPDRSLVELRRQPFDVPRSEALAIIDPNSLPPDERAAVWSSVRRRRFIPEVRRVRRVEQKTTVNLHVDTDRGPATIRITGSSAVKRHGDVSIVYDASGARFEVRPERLDAKSRDLVAGVL